jgi:rubrerythrin
MFSMMPIYLEKIPQDVRDKEILLTAIIAELDAVNLYERLAAMTKDKSLRSYLWMWQKRKRHMWANSRHFC